MCFKDACNSKSNQKHYGIIRASNLCVAPETFILTDKGQQKISSLENQYVNIWNGKEFSESLVKKTGTNQKLIKITFTNGAELECTKYHKFYISDKYHSKKPLIVDAKDLKKDMKLWKCDFPVIDNDNNNFKYPYTHGLFCSDGTYDKNNNTNRKCQNNSIKGKSYCGYHKKYNIHDTNITEKCNAIVNINKQIIALYSHKKKLVDYLKLRKEPYGDKILYCSPMLDLPKKFEVPINFGLSNKLRWLEGYMDGDGTISNNGTNQSLQSCSINKKFLENIRLMCQTLGIDPKIIDGADEGYRKLPDGQGGYKNYLCKKIYRLLITSVDLYKLVELGFSPKRLKINKRKPQRDARNFVKVKLIEDNERVSDTYCFNELNKHAGIFNGIYAGNCSEILEYHDEKEYATCCLASLSLPKFITQDKKYDFDKLEKVAGQIVRNLNRAIDINLYPVPETKLSNFRHRPLGIGVQGLADVFAIMRYPYDSKEALQLNNLIFETIYYGCVKASMELSQKDGPYETFKGSPISKGLFQFDLWNVKPSDRYDWDKLRKQVMEENR
jgi:ribonucleoside-diphosphate reductase alpha chain